MITSLKFLAVMVCALACGASALTLRVTDRDLQTLIAQGSSQGNTLTLQVSAAASGPVMVFIIDGSNVLSYPATIRNGDIVLEGQPGTNLTKLLAGRGISLATEPVATTPAHSFSLPGLSAPAGASDDQSSTPAGGSGSAGSDKGPKNAVPNTTNSGSDKGSGKGKDNGKDEKKDDKKDAKEKGRK